MKKRLFVSLLTVFILSLSACSPVQPQESTPPTDTQPTSAATVPSETIAPEPAVPDTFAATEPKTTVLAPPEGAEVLTRQELEALNQQLFDWGEDRSNPGCLFLASYYDVPEDVDLFVLFCGGLGLDSKPTEEEWEYLENLGLNREYDHHRTTPEQIEQTLLTYTGLTLEETNKVGLDQMRYVEELGAYYTKSPGTYWSIYTLLEGYRTQAGELVLYYEGATRAPKDPGIVTLRVNENGSGYWFVSNQPYEE